MAKRLFIFAIVAVVAGGAAYSHTETRAWIAGKLGLTKSAGVNTQKASGKPGRAVRPVPVQVAVAGTRSVPVRLEGVGVVKARSTVAIKSRIEGQITEALVREGQRVKKGDVLFKLDARPLTARLKEAEANLARDTVNHKKAITDFNRLKILSSQGYSPQTRRDDAEALVDTTRAAVRASEAALEFARLNLDYAIIRSPIDGRVGNILISVGNIVKANDTPPILMITETKPIYVSFSLPERHIDALRQKVAAEGQAPTVEVTTQASAQSVTGKLFFINNEVDVATGTIELQGVFENADETLVPGQFARAGVLMETLNDAVVVPSRSVQINQKGQFVWVVDDKKKIHLRMVDVGPDAGSDVVISKGLKPGETVVTDGQLRLFQGASVIPQGAGGEKKEKKKAPDDKSKPAPQKSDNGEKAPQGKKTS
jgi:multidrug efflux system membrane fusion protein